MKDKGFKSVKVPHTAGYPQDDIGMDDVWMYGRYMKGVNRKSYKTAKGGGIAVKGKKFRDE